MGQTQLLTNAGALASRKRLLASQVRGNLRSVAKAHAERWKAAAVQLSGGTLSPADKRRLGYPYALRFAPGSAGMPDFILNQVSGSFKASWRTRVQQTAKGWTITLYNDSPEAKYLMGTKTARMRPILVQVDKMMSGELPARVRKVTRRAATDNGAGGSLLGGLLYAATVGASSAAGGLADAF